MVVGNAPESIQYPWLAPCVAGRGREREVVLSRDALSSLD